MIILTPSSMAITSGGAQNSTTAPFYACYGDGTFRTTTFTFSE